MKKKTSKNVKKKTDTPKTTIVSTTAESLLSLIKDDFNNKGWFITLTKLMIIGSIVIKLWLWFLSYVTEGTNIEYFKEKNEKFNLVMLEYVFPSLQLVFFSFTVYKFARFYRIENKKKRCLFKIQDTHFLDFCFVHHSTPLSFYSIHVYIEGPSGTRKNIKKIQQGNRRIE